MSPAGPGTDGFATIGRSYLKRSLRTMWPGLLVVAAAALALVLLEDSTLASLTGRYALVVYGGAILADSAGGDASPEAILKKADQALYRAKKDGRNRISL